MPFWVHIKIMNDWHNNSNSCTHIIDNVLFSADDPKSGQYSEDEGWQFITLGDQVTC